MDDGNEWSCEGRNILIADRLSTIRNVLENVGPIIVEHWFYYGSCSPDRLLFDDFDEFVAYLNAKAKPGDAFHVWSFAQACRDDNTVADGKYPDTYGRVPKRGAY